MKLTGDIRSELFHYEVRITYDTPEVAENRRIVGEAKAEDSTWEEGEWTPDLRERYADRIQARLARHIPNLEASILAHTALSPADLLCVRKRSEDATAQTNKNAVLDRLR